MEMLFVCTYPQRFPFLYLLLKHCDILLCSFQAQSMWIQTYIWWQELSLMRYLLQVIFIFALCKVQLQFGPSAKLKNHMVLISFLIGFLFWFLPKSSYYTCHSCILPFLVKDAEELVNDHSQPWTSNRIFCLWHTEQTLLRFILPNQSTDYQTHYLADSSLTRQFAYRATECTSVLSMLFFCAQRLCGFRHCVESWIRAQRRGWCQHAQREARCQPAFAFLW